MKALVTGGAGFIGSHLVEALLSKGYNVVVIDNFCGGRSQNLTTVESDIRIIEADISTDGTWSHAFSGVDCVFHLAALADIVPSIQQPEKYFRTNVHGTFNVIQAARLHNIKRFIYVASSSAYGIPKIYPTSESAPICPKYPYALTKHLGEELVMHWANVYSIPSLSLRLFNVYGPRSRTTGTYGAVFGVFLAQKLAGKPLTVVGDGTQTRDFTYVSDVCQALIVAAESARTQRIYNVGSGHTVSVNRVVELLGGDSVNIPKRPGEPDCTFADISKISLELGWNPQITIEEGAKKVLENIEDWRDAPVWTPAKIDSATKDWFHYLDDKVS
ncbi:MAG: NAD-dependent dehydratase [Acidiferrobacteraceae bacterium]|nr:NAD-dependent dehydratase [Acidiferrobacteraceae bacterium]